MLSKPNNAITKGDAIITIGSISYWLVAACLFSVHYIRNGLDRHGLRLADLEPADKIAFIALILSTLLSAYTFLSKNRWKKAFAATSYSGWLLVIIFIGSVIANPSHVTSPLLTFTGFGGKSALLMVPAMPIIVLALAQDSDLKHLSRTATGLITLCGQSASILIACLYLLDLIQPIWGLHDPYHASYFLNEILGPATGSYPLIDYATQYTNLFGLLLSLIAILPYAAKHILSIAPIFTSVAAIATISLAVASVASLLPYRIRWSAVILIVPITLVGSQLPSSINDTIAFHFAVLPGRLFFPALIGFTMVCRHFRFQSFSSVAALGLLNGMALFNNIESGLASAISSFAILVLTTRDASNFKSRLMGFLIGLPLPLALYVAYFTSLGRQVHLDWYYMFATSFTKGFAALPAPLFGFHYIIFPFSLATISIVIHAYARRPKKLMNLLSSDNCFIRNQCTSGLLALFYSIFAIIMSPYFLGRSSMWGQLQSFLLPFSVGSAACFAYWINAEYAMKEVGWHYSIPLPYLAVALSSSLAVASIWLHPNISQEMLRIFPHTLFTQASNGLPRLSISSPAEISLPSINPRLFPPLPAHIQDRVTFLADFANMRNAERSNANVRFAMPLNTIQDGLNTSPQVTSMFCSQVLPFLAEPSTKLLSPQYSDNILEACIN